MQIAVDPDPAGALVQVGAAALVLVQIGVEQAGRAPVEGERRGRHLAELDPESGRIGGQELAEGGLENGEYVLAALLSAGLRDRHRWCLLVRTACVVIGAVLVPLPTRDRTPECPAGVSGAT